MKVDGTSQAKAIEVTVMQDDWKYFMVEATVNHYEIYVGKPRDDIENQVDFGHKLFYTALPSHDEHNSTSGLTLRFCNMLQRIQGNNQVLRR